MINIKVPLAIPLNQLSEKYLPYVDWTNVPTSDIQSLPTSSLKYVSTNKLLATYVNNQNAGISDEDLMSIIVRDMKILNNQYDYSKDSRLEDFLHTFCTEKFLSKYNKQIYALCKLNNTSKRAISLLLTYGFQPLHKLVDFGLYEIRWNVLNRREVPMHHRYEILRSGSYMGYMIVYDKEFVEMAPVLYTCQLESMPFMIHVPYNFDDYAISHIFQGNTVMFPGIADRKDITWDDLIDLYLAEKIHYNQIEAAWEYFLRNGDFDREAYENRISSMMPNNTVFKKEDFL